MNEEPAVILFIQRLSLHDSLDNLLPNLDDTVGLNHFYDEYHTYSYSVPGFGAASSCLDRWYGTGAARSWMANASVDVMGLHSDHRGLLLQLCSPSNPVRVKKESGVFPVPEYAREQADRLVIGESETLRKHYHHLATLRTKLRWSGMLLKSIS
ncbi:hypothetical protein PC128_g16831 [Phytophthora cactorum]|nr:hypothetical protein PC128_g16831 [Phytophthora cactorum]KAG4044122.1 hypothetical protein PC123_g20423 [Phytophthora cactorum]